VKDVTIPKDESKITASDIAANAMAHAVVGAVVAQLSGQDAAAGAMGASSGELIARAIMADQYPGKTANDLTEEEKQSVSALSTLASGLVSGLAGNSTASAASGAQSGRNAVENNFFGKALVEGCAIAAPCRTKVAEKLLELGVKAGITGVVAKEIADNLSSEELEHLVRLNMMGNDEITVKYLSSLQDKYGSDNASTPNLGKDLTNEQKAELGGSGSGTPGGWEPQDEENARNNDSSSDPKSRSQYEQYLDSLRASMEKPNVKDDNLKNIINDLYRPNAKVGSGSTADAVRYELATGEKVGGRGHVEKAQTYSKALQDWLNKNPQASSSDRAVAENVLKDMQNALKGKK
ncbi:VENN motif pre-toxin domain-containing protein, partial [Pectobacterium versatile]